MQTISCLEKSLTIGSISSLIALAYVFDIYTQFQNYNEVEDDMSLVEGD